MVGDMDGKDEGRIQAGEPWWDRYFGAHYRQLRDILGAALPLKLEAWGPTICQKAPSSSTLSLIPWSPSKCLSPVKWFGPRT